MSLVTRPIANLFNGVSQQPASLRSPTQCELQENFYSSIATGVRKRPPTRHVAKLSVTADALARIHFINRDAVEKYEVRIRNGVCEVWNLLTGTAQVVNTPDGVAYLASTNPKADFDLITVADYTFIVNRTITTAMDVAVSPGALAGTKQSFSLLPAATGGLGYWKIEGTPDSNFDNYYVQDTAAGIYTEVCGRGITTTFNASTMPHQLVRNSGGDFTFKRATWAARAVGDNISNPIPAFIGQKIQGVFFHSTRLGILAGENMFLSRAGSVFNLFAETATAVLDSDPIDKSAAYTKVALLKTATSFNNTLLIFSDSAQFQLSGGDTGTLTTKNAKLTVVTEFDSDALARPVGVGQTMFFAQPRGNATGIREYYVEQDSVTNDAADVTAHCPTYIQGSVNGLAATTTEDVLAVLSSGNLNGVNMYKFYWTEESKKLQSAWSNFVFATADKLLGVGFTGTRMYLAVDRADGHYLEYLDLQPDLKDGALTYDVLLDRKVSLTGVYDGTQYTTWTLPYSDSADMLVVLNDAWGFNSGKALTTTRPLSTTIRAVGNYSAFPVWVGRKYTARYRFSRFFVKDDQGQSITTAVLKVLNMVINFAASGYFRAEVTVRGRPAPFKYVFSGKVLGTASATLGEQILTAGEFRFPVVADSAGVTIDIINDSHVPCSLLSAEWEAEFTMRSKRI